MSGPPQVLFCGLFIDADLTVAGHGRKERKLVRFRLTPAERRADEFVFIPTEIIKSIGQTPADWQDQGWE